MSFFKDKFFTKNFALLLVLNTIYISLAQFYNLPKFFDSYWCYSFIYREAMLFCTYFMAFCLIYALPFTLIKRAFVVLVSLVSIVLLIVNLFLALYFDTTLNDYLVSVILQSDPNEAQEFLSTYVNVKFILCVLLCLGVLFLSYRYGDFAFNALLKTKRALRIFWAVFIALLIALIFIHIFKLRPHYQRSSDVIYNVASSTKSSLQSILAAMKEYEQISANFEQYIQNINYSKVPKEEQIQNIVLIIGESVQRNLMQIYGYYLPNTPNLSKLHKEKSENVLIFNDVIASQATTYESLSQVLSFANQDDISRPWYEYLNIIDAMKLGGYKSINISNQERFSIFSKASTTIFNRCDETHWTSLSSSFGESKPDEKILPILDKVKQNNNQALFLSIHLMGNHATYYTRYPQNFAHFSSKDVKSTNGKKIIAEYSNALLYTDFVLDEIIKRFENEDSIIIYISDHGDDVYDFSSTELNLHSDSKINRFMLEIPFIVIVSDEFKAKHPEIYAKIKSATNKPFMIDDLSHAIIDIAGFTIQGFDTSRSLFNTNFNAHRKRMVGKKAQKDYDKELKQQLRVSD